MKISKLSLFLLTVFGILLLAGATGLDASAQQDGPDSNPHAKGPHPGIYVFLDTSHVDSEVFPVVTGGNNIFYWDRIELADEYYDWSVVEEWLQEQASKGKAGNIGFSPYHGRCCGGTLVPRWLAWRNEDTVVRCEIDPTRPVFWPIPRYWHPEYLEEYREYIHAFAARYDGDPRISWIAIGTGIFGEAKPGDVDDWDCLRKAGLTSAVWIQTSKTIMEYFAESFHQTPLLYQFAPTYNPDGESIAQRRELTDYAVSLGIGLKHNGLTPDANSAYVDDPGKSYYKAGQWDPFQSWWRDVPTAWETYDTLKCMNTKPGINSPEYQVDSGITMSCVYAGLHAHADYFVMSRDLVTDPARQPYLEFANKYLGADVEDTDSVWVALREHEPEPTGDWFPAKGNYNFWLYQNDAAPGGKTRAEFDVTPAREGRYTRRTDRLSGNPNMYFNVYDGWLYRNTGATVTVEVIYLDRGTDTWSLYYDAVDSPDKLAATIRKTNTDQWLTVTFELPDAYFGNRLPGGGAYPGSDFYLTSNDWDDYFHRVRVFKSGVQPTPTPQPIVTATPTPTRQPGEPQSEAFYLRLRDGVNGYNGTEDTWIGGKACSNVEDDLGTTPHGSEQTLSLRASSNVGWPANDDVCNFLIRFDLSPIPPGSTIVDATLAFKGIWNSNAGRLYFNAHDVTKAWKESEATWYQARNGLLWNEPGADNPGDRIEPPVDGNILSGFPADASQAWGGAHITPLVQRWLNDPSSNRGVLIRPHGNFVQWNVAASEYPEVRFRPALEIRYFPPSYQTPTPTASPTPGVTPTPTATPTATSTPTATPTETATPLPTTMHTPTPTSSPTPDSGYVEGWVSHVLNGHQILA
ncbi:MAG: DNRLRE domain-containing protein, partial [Caldilineales bacterium]|nr:DNRLRE domain-containing protein [Caldilineales bacterium]